MYPYIKLAITLFKARSRPKLAIHEKSVLNFRAGITDIDIFMELGRRDYSSRVGFVDIMRKNK
ncbi:MAG: hypothetical protein HKN34_00350 [Gammaproteobacteria bacterium]|nr:hypothetical protein [Gammaproteobacteria bacterium]